VVVLPVLGADATWLAALDRPRRHVRASARLIFIAIGALAILVALPWLLMWTTMAAWCAPMMNGMRDLMGPGMVGSASQVRPVLNDWTV